MNLSQLALLLGGWANHLPAVWRKRVYKSVKVVAGLATLFLVVLPLLPNFGLVLNDTARYGAILTAAIAFLGHLADANTFPEPAVDLTPAPEGGNPTPPPGMSDADPT